METKQKKHHKINNLNYEIILYTTAYKVSKSKQKKIISQKVYKVSKNLLTKEIFLPSFLYLWFIIPVFLVNNVCSSFCHSYTTQQPQQPQQQHRWIFVL